MPNSRGAGPTNRVGRLTQQIKQVSLSHFRLHHYFNKLEDTIES